jgi:hypothetical protein
MQSSYLIDVTSRYDNKLQEATNGIGQRVTGGQVGWNQPTAPLQEVYKAR